MFNSIKNKLRMRKATVRLSSKNSNRNWNEFNWVWLTYTHGSIFADEWSSKQIPLPSFIPIRKVLIFKPKHMRQVKQTTIAAFLIGGVIVSSLSKSKKGRR